MKSVHPVKSQFGYHIIQKTGEKEKKPFDQMKKDIEYQVKSAKLTNDVIKCNNGKRIKIS